MIDIFRRKSAVNLLQMIASKEVSSREVTEFFLRRIEEINPDLNAVILKFYDQALAKADLADAKLRKGEKMGRLHGLPFTIKECFDYLDSPSTLGVLARKNDRPTANDAYLQALLNEGGIVLGKTNVPQLLIFIESYNRVYGKTNNPYNPKFSPGGSSGGEGAIIGAGGSPVGIGSDVGGSVRFPAAFCGICSLKPTMWRTPDLTRYGEKKLEGLITSVTGVLGNYAEDLHLFLQIIDDSLEQNPQSKPLKNYKNVEVNKLRVGYFLSDEIFEPMEAVKRGVLQAVGELEKIGVEAIEFKPPRLEFAEEIFYRILTVDGGRIFSEVLGAEKPVRQLKNSLMIASASPAKRNFLKSLADFFGQKSLSRILPFFGGKGQEYLTFWGQQQAQYRVEFLSAMEKENLDALISPVCALPAFLHNSVDKIGLGGTYTLLHNVLGFPAGVARVGAVQSGEAKGRKAGLDILQRTAAKIEKQTAGLPLAVQIAAPPWREDIVLSLIEILHQRDFC